MLVFDNGTMTNTIARMFYGVRPVLYLSKSITLTGTGTGTNDENIYRIS